MSYGQNVNKYLVSFIIRSQLPSVNVVYASATSLSTIYVRNNNRCTTANFSYICYKQREKPSLVGVLEKKFSKPYFGFRRRFRWIANPRNF